MIWTWREFKKRVEDLGLKDDDRIDYIDVSGYDPLEWIVVRRDSYGEVTIS